MGVSDDTKKKDKKSSKKSLKNETKAQKVPAAMKVNNMGQHDKGFSKDPSIEQIQNSTDSGPNNISNPNISIDVKDENKLGLGSSKSGIIKGDRYESKKKKKQDLASSMEFDAGSQEGKEIIRSKSQQKNAIFGQENDISAIQRDHDDIINLNFRKNTKSDKNLIEDPSQVYGMGNKKKGKKGGINRSSQMEFDPTGTRSGGMKVQDSLTSLMNEFMGKKNDRGGESQLKYLVNDRESVEKDRAFKKPMNQVLSKKATNMKLINQIENTQAPYFGLNAQHHQHEDAYGTYDKVKTKVFENQNQNLDQQDVSDNFKLARQISYDLSSEFQEFTPRQEGLIENWARIGEPAQIQSTENENDDDESESESEDQDDDSDGSSSEEESSEDVMSPSGTVSKSKTEQT